MRLPKYEVGPRMAPAALISTTGRYRGNKEVVRAVLMAVVCSLAAVGILYML